MMYWQKEIETMDRKDLVKFQLERLKTVRGNSFLFEYLMVKRGVAR